MVSTGVPAEVESLLFLTPFTCEVSDTANVRTSQMTFLLWRDLIRLINK